MGFGRLLLLEIVRIELGYAHRPHGNTDFEVDHDRDFYLTYRERAPAIRAEELRTSLVQHSRSADPTKILHEAGAEFAKGFSGRLDWTHYRTLTKVQDPAARAFYEIEAERGNWSTPILERQIYTALHLRLLKSRNKAGMMELAREGQAVERPSDLMSQLRTRSEGRS